MPFSDFPAEICCLILEQLREDDPGYTHTIKSLSLVNKQLSGHVRPKLWDRLYLYMIHGTDYRRIHDFISSNPFLLTTTRVLHLYGLFYNPFPPSSTQRESDYPRFDSESQTELVNRMKTEVSEAARVFGALDCHRCIHVLLEHPSMSRTFDVWMPNPLIQIVAATFLSLTHLTIIKGPIVNLAIVGHISTLTCLALLQVDLQLPRARLASWYQSNQGERVLPRLTQLAMIDTKCNIIAPDLSSIGLEKLFDLRSLESLAIGICDGSRPDLSLEHLAQICGKTLKELSVHIQRFYFPNFCRKEILHKFKAVHHLHFYFSDGIQRHTTSLRWGLTGLSFDPAMENLRMLRPPPSLARLSLGFRCRDWREVHIPVRSMNSVICKFHKERWTQLRQIDLQLVNLNESEDSRPENLKLRREEMSRLLSKGVVVSVLPNQSRIKCQWPYYLHNSMQTPEGRNSS